MRGPRRASPPAKRRPLNLGLTCSSGPSRVIRSVVQTLACPSLWKKQAKACTTKTPRCPWGGPLVLRVVQVRDELRVARQAQPRQAEVVEAFVEPLAGL